MKNIKKALLERAQKDKLVDLNLKNSLHAKRSFNKSLGMFNKLNVGKQYSHQRSRTISKELDRPVGDEQYQILYNYADQGRLPELAQETHQSLLRKSPELCLRDMNPYNDFQEILLLEDNSQPQNLNLTTYGNIGAGIPAASQSLWNSKT